MISEGRLDDTFVDALCDPPEVFTYGGMIAHVLTFSAYNRTLVVQQLGELGVADSGLRRPHEMGGGTGMRAGSSHVTGR